MSKTVLADVDGFTPVMDNVLKETSLITAAVFGRIWRYCQMQNNVCQATVEKIAEGIGLSRQAIMEHIKILETKGFIEDTTPDLRNRPHTYRDTGKAGLHIGISGVNVVDSETSPAVNVVDSTVNVVDSGCKPRVHEDSIKKESKKEVENTPVFVGYWDTLIEMIQGDKSVPPCNKVKIALGRPVSFQDGVLIVQHPEPEWAQQRFARTFDNWIVALCPGAHVMFECSRQSEPRSEPGMRDYAR